MIGLNDNHRTLYRNALLKAVKYGATTQLHFYTPGGVDAGLNVRTNALGYLCSAEGTQQASSYFVKEKATIYVSLDNGNSWPISWVVDTSVGDGDVGDGNLMNANGVCVWSANAGYNYTLNYDDLKNKPKISLWSEAQQTETVTGSTATISVNMYTKVLMIKALVPTTITLEPHEDTTNIRYGQRIIVGTTGDSEVVTLALGAGDSSNKRTLEPGFTLPVFTHKDGSADLLVYPEETSRIVATQTAIATTTSTATTTSVTAEDKMEIILDTRGLSDAQHILSVDMTRVPAGGSVYVRLTGVVASGTGYCTVSADGSTLGSLYGTNNTNMLDVECVPQGMIITKPSISGTTFGEFTYVSRPTPAVTNNLTGTFESLAELLSIGVPASYLEHLRCINVVIPSGYQAPAITTPYVSISILGEVGDEYIGKRILVNIINNDSSQHDVRVMVNTAVKFTYSALANSTASGMITLRQNPLQAGAASTAFTNLDGTSAV